jgi:hypothetical protein
MDAHIQINALPSFVDFNPTIDAIQPTDDQIGLGIYQNVDNQTPVVADPANWFIFDAGDNNDPSKPKWMEIDNNGVVSPVVMPNTYYGPTNSKNLTPGAAFPNVKVHGSSSQSFTSGGPRNLGYINISDTTWWRINNYVDNSTQQNTYTLRNEAWKEGSIELTIKPQKANCTLVSGALFAGAGVAGSLSGGSFSNPPGDQTTLLNLQNGIDFATTNTAGQIVEVAPEYGVGPGEEKAYAVAYSTYATETTGQTFTVPDVSKGVNLTDVKSTFRLFKVDLVNGFIRVSYEVFYGPNKKYIEFFNKTNLMDGNWHHIVINRPSPFTFKTSEQRYGGDGCFEIWVDGQLEQRDFNIKSTEVLPVPQILFNNHLNAGILNWWETSLPGFATADQINVGWRTDTAKIDNYVGGIRDFVFRQSSALSPHFVKLNYIYSMLNTETSTTLKAKNLSATAKIVDPQVSTNKPKILKLYWNNLLKDKTKCKNGLEFDDSYTVYSYSITYKNLISPTQTFNLDLNDTTLERKFLNNVKAAIGKHMFIPAPALIMTATSDFALTGGQTGLWGQPIMIDTYDDARILAEAVPAPWYINNMLFGGVSLTPGDKVLLFNQNKPNENGVWQYNGGNIPMTRPTDIDVSELLNAHVYVEQGKYAGKTFVQTNNITHIRKSPQVWREVDNEVNLSTINSYPIHTVPWSDSYGNQRLINVNSDIDFDYDIIAFMNYPEENVDFFESVPNFTENEFNKAYKDFINNLKTAVNNGKSIYISSPQLAIDFGVVSKVTYVPQLLEESGDAQSAAISPFESGEASTSYFDTHRNMKYKLCTVTPGLTNFETYIMTDFVTYSPNRTDSEYHIKYLYRQNGLLEGDEFYIPGLTTLPETLNEQLPGYLHNQKGIKDLATFQLADILMGNCVTRLANNYYVGSTPTSNPYDDNVTTIVATSGLGKIFVNCIEDGYAYSRSDYNKAKIQNVTAGQNSETVATAAWQYSTKRLNKQNLYDFSENTNPIGQTTPTNGGGGAMIQGQSHCSNGLIRKNTNKDDLVYQSDLYPDVSEEYFETTEIPVLSMTWLGLKWLAE